MQTPHSPPAPLVHLVLINSPSPAGLCSCLPHHPGAHALTRLQPYCIVACYTTHHCHTRMRIPYNRSHIEQPPAVYFAAAARRLSVTARWNLSSQSLETSGRWAHTLIIDSRGRGSGQRPPHTLICSDRGATSAQQSARTAPSRGHGRGRAQGPHKQPHSFGERASDSIRTHTPPPTSASAFAPAVNRCH